MEGFLQIDIGDLIVWAIVEFALVWDSINQTKKPFDEKKLKARFNFKKHWWSIYWDDLGKWLIMGFIGGVLLAGELGLYLIDKFFAFDDTADLTLNITSVAFCTSLFARPKRTLEIIVLLPKAGIRGIKSMIK